MKNFIILFLLVPVLSFALELKKLIVYDNSELLCKKEKSTLGYVEICFQDNDLALFLQKYHKKTVDMKLLETIKEETAAYYKAKGNPFVLVHFPINQDITDGSVKMVVTKGKIGKVKAKGAKYFSNEKIASNFRNKPGQEIQIDKIADDLSWLNKDPFRSIDLIYEKGENLGETDIVLDVKDRFPVRPYIGYEYNRYPVAGNSRWTAGAQIGNLFHQDHQLNVQVVTASNVHRWFAFSGNYFVPLPWRDEFKVFGSYCHSRPNQDDNPNLLPESDMNGISWQVGARYHYLLKSLKRWKQEIVFGYDFRRTNNFLAYGSELIYRHLIDISQFVLRYEGNYQGETVTAAAGVSLILSPGGMTTYNHTKYFQQERPGANCSYAYQMVNFDFTKYFSKNYSIALSGLAQISTTKLMPTEEFSLGGHLTVRGYDENAAIGDYGFLLRSELRFPPFALFSPKRYPNTMQFLAFVDGGFAAQVDKNVDNRNFVYLLSIGPGIRYSIKDYLNLRVDYGVQIKPLEGTLFGSHSRQRAHVGLYLGF